MKIDTEFLYRNQKRNKAEIGDFYPFVMTEMRKSGR